MKKFMFGVLVVALLVAGVALVGQQEEGVKVSYDPGGGR